ARTIKIAVLTGTIDDNKRNQNQKTLIDTLAAAGGRVAVEALRALDIPRSTLDTLVRRKLVEIVEEPESFTVSGVKPRPSLFEFQFNQAQRDALERIQERASARKFSGVLMHGVTGSGKTAVYLAGRSEEHTSELQSRGHLVCRL